MILKFHNGYKYSRAKTANTQITKFPNIVITSIPNRFLNTVAPFEIAKSIKPPLYCLPDPFRPVLSCRNILAGTAKGKGWLESGFAQQY